jgi:hypothetical protein
LTDPRRMNLRGNWIAFIFSRGMKISFLISSAKRVPNYGTVIAAKKAAIIVAVDRAIEIRFPSR